MKDVFISDYALRELIEKVNKNPNSETYTELAKFYNYRSYYNKAINAAKKAIEFNRFNFDAWFELIMASGFKSDADLNQIKEELEKIYDFLELKEEVSDAIYRVLAFINYFLENDGVAISLINKAIEINPEHSVNYEIYGYILHAIGDVKKALETFGKAIFHNPESFRVLRMIAKCYFDLGESEKAKLKVEESLRLEPFFIASWHLLGEIYLSIGDFVKGTQALAKAISINPEDWSSYFILGEYYLSEKEYDSAIAEMKKIERIMGDKDPIIIAEVNNFIGYVYTQKGDDNEAIKHFNIAIQYNEEYALPFYNLGKIESERGNYNKAIKFYKEAIKRDKFHVPSYTEAGFAYLNLKKTKQAEKFFLKAVEYDENEYWAYLGLSEVARLEKRFADQLKYVEKAREINPKDSEIWNYVGIAYQCNKNFKAAEDAYLVSLAINPLNRKAANNLAYLYEKLITKAEDEGEKRNYTKLAIESWKVRLLACREAGTSIKGAVNHLRKLGMEKREIDNLIRFGEIEELPLIKVIAKEIVID
ncbi:hypothetical protein TTHT_0729 [Thermotomaculum hydrothermale]|uniref:Tetratricopeptide TPR_1 repeat-containing protein n=1 Tax=Thermotomaculum hydrothermale TaxID=981385 RepID=A0A7R6PX55_9BACT|nr:tetratricopeptide repeat protein [Thermotomaculum hydrothermale]BBB32300.1 hypothetical protein TTHT_0729 [Thermotomaculum hydrothermale]